MNEEQVDQLLKKYKEELIVDETFKRELRKTFVKKKKHPLWFQQFSILGMAASILLVIYAFLDVGVTPVNASSLKIWDQLSFFDFGSGETVSMAEREGKLYLALKEKGIFEYGEQSFTKITDQKVDSFQWNRTGNQILFSSDGNIGIYDLRAAKSQFIELNGIYSHPTWMGEQTILLEKHDRSNPNSSLIVKLNLSTMKETVIGPGEKPSYIEQDRAVIFERDNQIIYRDLKDLQERLIDQGSDPSVSRDGAYVAYVKTEQNMQDVWISDLKETTKKRITSNIANTNPEVDLAIGEAIYHFSSPVWSTDSNHVYVFKQWYSGSNQVTRIDFTKNKLTAENTVAKYIQALMSREEDFAKSLLANPPAEPLTGSNPQVVGYNLLSIGTDKGRTYVDAQAFWSYTANPFYQMIKSRYYLESSENGFIISSIEPSETIEVSSLDEKEQVKLITNGSEQILFGKEEIPGEFLVAEGDYRIASLAYNESTQTVYFTLQYMREEDRPSHSFVILLSYSIATKHFSKLDQITDLDARKDVGVSKVTVDPSGQFVSMDLYHDSAQEPLSLTYIYNTKTMERTDLRTVLKDTEIANTFGQYWENGKITFQVESNGQFLLFEHDAK